MGGIFSGYADYDHACLLIIPKDDARTRPDDDAAKKYHDRWADVSFSIEHHATYQEFALQIVRGFGYDSLHGFDPDLGFRDPKKNKERVIGKYTQIGNLIANPKIVFVCYLYKADALKKDRKEIRGLVRKNSKGEMASADLTRRSSDPQVSQIPPKRKSRSGKDGSDSSLHN